MNLAIFSKNKVFILLLAISIAFALIREEDLMCHKRDKPFTKIIGIENAAVGELKSVALLSKTNEILLCGSYNFVSTKGIISSSSKNGTLNWTYALHMP